MGVPTIGQNASTFALFELALRGAEGLTVTIEPAWSKTPFRNVLAGVRGASPRASE
jgi:hypothetical protein